MSLFSFPSGLVPVIDVFEKLGVRYYIGGSVASSAHASPDPHRTSTSLQTFTSSTRGLLTDAFTQSFYVDFAMVQEAIRRRTSFNLVHFESMTKIDIFVLKDRLFDLQVFERISSSGLENSLPGRQFHLASPEDITLNKLEWYRQGGFRAAMDRRAGRAQSAVEITRQSISTAMGCTARCG
jgi:hypothetical protein